MPQCSEYSEGSFNLEFEYAFPFLSSSTPSSQCQAVFPSTTLERFRELCDALAQRPSSSNGLEDEENTEDVRVLTIDAV